MLSLDIRTFVIVRVFKIAFTFQTVFAQAIFQSNDCPASPKSLYFFLAPTGLAISPPREATFRMEWKFVCHMVGVSRAFGIIIIIAG